MVTKTPDYGHRRCPKPVEFYNKKLLMMGTEDAQNM